MPKMIKFQEWMSHNKSMQMLPEENEANAETKTDEMGTLLAKLDELQSERRKLMKVSNKLEAQLLDIDIQLTRNDIAKLELEEKRGEIKKAIEISSKTRKEGKIRNEDEEDIEPEPKDQEEISPKL